MLAIPYGPLREIYESRPELLWGVVALLAGRLRNTDVALADSVFLDVTGRTAKRLLELAGDADEFALPVTQEELAGMVGASRERVNKAIASFVRLGLDRAARPPLPHHRPRAARPAAPADRRRRCTAAVASTVSRRRGRRRPGARRRRRRRRRCAGRGRVVDEAVVGALVAHDLDAGRLERGDVGGAAVHGSTVPAMARTGHAAGAPPARRAARPASGCATCSGTRIIP